ncbi:hypothetical protein RLIN73S_01385 [Rhodanobacter lindaniclasticus]
MPPDRQAETLTWMFAALDTVEPPLWHLQVIDTLHPGEEWARLRRPGAVEEAKVRLQALSACLDGRSYLLDRFTAADLLMVTVLRFIRHTDLLPLGFPAARRLRQALRGAAAFQAALREQLAGYARHAPAAA